MDRSRVFISWSGVRSRVMATLLSDWLQDVLQVVDPFMSDTDIAAGDVWFDEIGANLASSRFAIICVTPENVDSTWLHFEAGAIGMSRDEGGRSSVTPYLLGLATTDLAPPLSLYQAVAADRDGTLRLVQSLNAKLDVRLDRDRLDRIFDRWWPLLETEIAGIEAPPTGAEAPERTERELLEELLTLQRLAVQAPRRVTPRRSPSRPPRSRDELLAVDVVSSTVGITPDRVRVQHHAPGAFRVLIGSPRSVDEEIEREICDVLARKLGADVVEIEWEPF